MTCRTLFLKLGEVIICITILRDLSDKCNIIRTTIHLCLMPLPSVLSVLIIGWPSTLKAWKSQEMPGN